MSTTDNGSCRAVQIALSSSLEGSLRPRSISDRYPRLTRAESDTSRSVRPCDIRAPRSTSPTTSRTKAAIKNSLSTSQSSSGERRRRWGWFPQSAGGLADPPDVPQSPGHVIDTSDHGEQDRGGHHYHRRNVQRTRKWQHE
ncbi:Uncharacterised protein [Mycobacterium tuberculosis]|uniref:Uncharacterized protein n=1 Tax=Mycobacterium tuberculosis TaxID=1773 RepID=A0A916LF46_MYCTX|nr:Uncharacterised protein [Mycobacterium tuberculosis]